MAWVRVTACAALLLLAGCDASAGSSRPLHGGPPSHYLLTIDQLVTPDFTVTTRAHALDAAALANAAGTSEQQLSSDGFAGAATVRYSRTADLGTSNGPVDVVSTVVLFKRVDGAHRALQQDVRALDAVSGAAPVSAGTLGEEAHADSVVREAPNGINVVQITLEWRVGNALSVIVVRGRYGGTRLNDALLLAHRMTELS